MVQNKLNTRLTQLETTNADKATVKDYIHVAALPGESDQEAIEKRGEAAKARVRRLCKSEDCSFILVRRQGKDFSTTTYEPGATEPCSTGMWPHPDNATNAHTSKWVSHTDVGIGWRAMDRYVRRAENDGVWKWES
ncbi:MAG: hypothetical protein JSS50_03520 [Proteobacteria bacterium]|nr:hypothetical protein [Pseudomonadota bacterium]